MNKKISVIVPAYNVEKYLRRCLDSLVYQTYPHLEILVIDDGSTDGTRGIIEEYVSRFAGKVFLYAAGKCRASSSEKQRNFLCDRGLYRVCRCGRFCEPADV